MTEVMTGKTSEEREKENAELNARRAQMMEAFRKEDGYTETSWDDMMSPAHQDDAKGSFERSGLVKLKFCDGLNDGTGMIRDWLKAYYKVNGQPVGVHHFWIDDRHVVLSVAESEWAALRDAASLNAKDEPAGMFRGNSSVCMWVDTSRLDYLKTPKGRLTHIPVERWDADSNYTAPAPAAEPAAPTDVEGTEPAPEGTDAPQDEAAAPSP